MRLDDYTCLRNSIYIANDYRKNNIGKLLVDKITNIAQLRKSDYIIAKVIPRNISAAIFFNNLGFESSVQTFIKDINRLLDINKHK